MKSVEYFQADLKCYVSTMKGEIGSDVHRGLCERLYNEKLQNVGFLSVQMRKKGIPGKMVRENKNKWKC